MITLKKPKPYKVWSCDICEEIIKDGSSTNVLGRQFENNYLIDDSKDIAVHNQCIIDLYVQERTK